MSTATMYARREPSGLVTLRQTRYAAQLAAGNEHPHDVCATAHDEAELRAMCEKHWPDADYSQLRELPRAEQARADRAAAQLAVAQSIARGALDAPAPYTRKQMMSEPYTTDEAAAARHRRYYAQFVSPGVLQLVASTFGRAAILASRDPHFNDIPLARWDRLEPSIKDLCLSRMGDVNGAVGPVPGAPHGSRLIAWSLGDAVCIAKEAARQLAEQEGSRVWSANK